MVEENKQENITKPEDTQADNISLFAVRQQRIEEIDKELQKINYHTENKAEIDQIQNEREKQYEETIKEIEEGLGIRLSDESVNLIKQKMINGVINQALDYKEHFDSLIKERDQIRRINCKII